MKKPALAVLLACSTLSGLALADGGMATLFNKSADYTMSVDYQICKMTITPGNSKFICGDVTTVDISNAKANPGKNFVQIAVPDDYSEVMIVQAVEKNGGQVVAKTIFNKSINNSYGETNCTISTNTVGILDDMNSSPIIVCSNATL